MSDDKKSNQSLAFDHYDNQGAEYDDTQKNPFFRWLTARDTAIILELLQPRSGETALDAGCGTGRQARVLTRLGLKVCAVDFSPRMIEAVRPHVARAVQADLDELDLGQQFDRVLCNGTLDFVRDPRRCVERLAAHVVPGGRLVIVAPRRSLLGYGYQLYHRCTSRVRVHIFDRHTLDDAARGASMHLVAWRHPFLHTLAMAWTRAASAPAA